jgi:hypothetical protein
VAQVLLNHPQVDPGFQEMGGIGMAQRVDREAAFVEAGLALGLAKGALDALGMGSSAQAA